MVKNTPRPTCSVHVIAPKNNRAKIITDHSGIPVGLCFKRTQHPDYALPQTFYPPVSDFTGLTNDQCAIFQKAHEGHNITCTAPGGTGKTFLITKIIIQKKSQKQHVTVISPLPKETYKNADIVIHPDDYQRQISHAAKLRQNIKVLIIDEYKSFPISNIEELNKFNQIILFGDSEQELERSKYIIATEFMRSIKSHKTTIRTIQRAYSSKFMSISRQNNYSTRYQAIEQSNLASAQSIKLLNITRKKKTRKEIIEIIIKRAIRHYIKNKRLDIMIIINSPNDLNKAKEILSRYALRKEQTNTITFSHPIDIQGREADIVIFTPLLLTTSIQEHQILAFLNILNGRARYQLEILNYATTTPNDPPIIHQTKKYFRFFYRPKRTNKQFKLDNMLSHAYYAEYHEDRIEIRSSKTGNGELMIILATNSIRQALSITQQATAKRWTSIIRAPEQLMDERSIQKDREINPFLRTYSS